MSPEHEILALMCAYLDGLEGAEDFLEALQRVEGTPAPLDPVQVPGIVATNPWAEIGSARSRPLIEAMGRHAARLDWWQPYEGDPRAGRGFAEGATACAVVGPWAPLKTDHVGAGYFALNQGVEYSEHAHAADEIYVLLAGGGTFQCAHYGEIRGGLDRVIRQPSWQWHSMQTPASPVLILWVWIGEGLDREAVFRGEDCGAVVVDL